MATVDKVLSILRCFSVEQPEWTVDALGAELGVSESTAYLYVRSLVEAGLLVSGGAGRYTIGPAVIELDRVTRRFDPLTKIARPTLEELTASTSVNAIGLLCRIYRLQVTCVDQCVLQPPSVAISYERGRPMQLTRGAASKVILANLASRPLRKVFESAPHAIQAAGLGDDWEEFKKVVRQLRKQPALVTRGELDPGMIGISAPVFDGGGMVLGSIGLVLENTDPAFETMGEDRMIAAVADAGRAVSEGLARAS